MCFVEQGSKTVFTGSFDDCKNYVDCHGGVVMEPTGLIGFSCVAYSR